LKTVNINLIGEFKKTIKSGRIEIKQDTLDSKTKFAVISFTIGTFVLLAASFGVWFAAENLSQRSKRNLEELGIQFTKLKSEEAFLAAYTNDLKNKKKAAEWKLLAKEQVDSLFIPWSSILSDLATKVPKKIIITDIKKNSSRQGDNSLKISGLVSAEEKPLTAVSFFILNLNEDAASLLTNAKIGKLEFDKDSELYKFEIETNLRKTKTGTNL